MTFEIAALVALVAVCAVVTLVVWRLVRLARRVSTQVSTQVRRRAVEVQAQLQPPGPRRDAIALRQRLADEVRALRRQIANSPDGRVFQADARQLLDRIATAAAALDADLAGIAALSGRAEQQAALATIGPQAEQLVATCHAARETMLRTLAADRRRSLDALSASVADQADALARYERTIRDLGT